MSNHQYPAMTIEIVKPTIGFWQRLGGTSLTIALIGHLIILVLGAYWIFQRIDRPKDNGHPFLPTAGGGKGTDTRVDVKKREKITPNTSVKRVSIDAISNVIIPDPGDQFGAMSALESLGGNSLGGMGNGDTFGRFGGNNSNPHMEDGSGRLFKLIPRDLSKRCSREDRIQRLNGNGGNASCEDAVVKGLRWLKAGQQPDGAFDAGGYKVAMTGLALLAYFGHCETPESEEFGESCRNGIAFLVNQGMKNDGRLATNYSGNPWCYEHAIATYALGEAYTFCKELKMDVPDLAEVTEKAGQFIIDNQHANGGWAYAYSTSSTGSHTDLSIVGWQIQALKACSHTNIKYRGMSTAISKGLKYVESCQNAEGAFGYTGPPAPGADATLTGVGMLCFQMWGKAGNSSVSKAAKSVLKDLNFDYNGKSGNLYQHYYESQAMMQRGGDDWKRYNDMFRDQILHNQNPDGSWKNAGGANHGANPVYNTCLCTLMLEVYYRFLSTDSKGGNRGIYRDF